jgi:hypothetical protein
MPSGARAPRADKRVPCLVQPPSLYDVRRFPYTREGEAPLRPPRREIAGARTAASLNPAD